MNAASERACHVAKITRKHKGKTYTSYLLRRSYRQHGKVKHENLANLSHLPEGIIELVKRALKGETFVPVDEAFRVTNSRPHGHVQAVLGMIEKLGLDKLINARPSRQRNLVIAMIAQQVIFPCSKLATTRHWHETTLAEQLAVEDASKNELYAAMDWLVRRQQAIEKKLAARHLAEGSLVLYDVSSSYYEGHTCPLARYGHDRDGKRGKKIIVWGVLADLEGRPVAIQVYPGNRSDPVTVADQIQKLRDRFGLRRVLLAGDRGMLTQTQIDTLKQYPGLGWLSALRSDSIRQLVDEGDLQPSLFDQQNLAEISSPEYPGERLIACYNPLRADHRRYKRQRLLRATEKKLVQLRREVARRTKKPLSAAEIALRAGKVIGRYKMAKHFELSIGDNAFSWQRNQESICCEEQLDGIYVIRTSAGKRRLSADQTVRSYKSLSLLEQGFRCLKGVDLKVRPVRHWVEPRVEAHFLICLLAYYVHWHLRQAWKSLLFDDEELSEARWQRDPVAAATPSESAQRKKKTQKTADGFVVHSFQTLLAHLGCRCRNRCEIPSTSGIFTFDRYTEPDALQAEAFRLLDL